ncbi:hypothetical protein GCM10011581_01070 [Saccharopolyspora subtropica]|uniref:DUF3159 domain-containing protein n=1 Tax=Saccharopolyspora thermophila TaxID=89367 RepID=A0A917JKQ9_9PSEU|nr:DUF3159 domain-containing protein [Saccharopolyspora subtropica]GGI67966.1 hypothetical protein GCM10011581_01070 [Saccharopolyspora subtropica]
MTQDRHTEIVANHQDDRDSFMRLLGGRGSVVDASLPPVAFGLGWYFGGESLDVGCGAAVVVSALVAGWRLYRGARPLAVLISLLTVVVGALIAFYTGDATDFFLPRLASNALSALAWMTSIAIRWPLLGVVVGTALGQAKRWRRDPDLLRAYSRGSWVWVGQYVTRLAVFIPLWLLDATGPLAIAQVVLTWPLVAACVGASWWVVRRSLPAGHPGLRHPRTGPA